MVTKAGTPISAKVPDRCLGRCGRLLVTYAKLSKVIGVLDCKGHLHGTIAPHTLAEVNLATATGQKKKYVSFTPI